MITTSCYHQVKDYDDTVTASVKAEALDHDRGFVPAINYMTLCKDCYKTYLSEGLILLTRQAEDDYLFGE